MKLKVFSYIIATCLLLAFTGSIAQENPPEPPKPPAPEFKKLELNLEKPLRAIDLQLEKIKDLDFDRMMANLDQELGKLGEDLSDKFEDLDNKIKKPSAGLFKTIEKSKTISKTYSVNANDKLSIDNQYGNVVINTWTKKEIKVDVIIKAFGANDDEASDLLNGVRIDESKQSDLISFRTSIAKNKSSWWGIRNRDGREERRGVQVNYQVYMPTANPLDITNKYGSTTVSDFQGPLNINSSYGSFSGKSLTNAANRIRVKYGSASIDELKSASVEVAYGSLKLESADRLNADISYSSAKIGKLLSSGDLNIKYSGGFKIGEIGSRVKDLNINSAYSSVSLGFSPAASFNFDVTVNYAGFKFDNDKVNITSKTPDDNARGFNPSKNYKGSYGKSSGAKIIIKSNYGSVNFL